MISSITLVAALTFAIVSVEIGIEKATAYTSSELTTSMSKMYNIAKVARVGVLTMESCTNQIEASNYTNADACINFGNIFEKHMSAAASEANEDIQKIGAAKGIN